MNNLKISIISISLALISGCATDGYGYRDGRESYQERPNYSYTTQNHLQYGVVQSITYGGNRDNHSGAVIGAVVGGLLGNTVGNGDGRTAATIGGAVIGGVVGNQVDKNRSDAYTLGIRLENGQFINVKQNDRVDLRVGQRVEVTTYTDRITVRPAY